VKRKNEGSKKERKKERKEERKNIPDVKNCIFL
jgi:hypothetical protein